MAYSRFGIHGFECERPDDNIIVLSARRWHFAIVAVFIVGLLAAEWHDPDTPRILAKLLALALGPAAAWMLYVAAVGRKFRFDGKRKVVARNGRPLVAFSGIKSLIVEETTAERERSWKWGRYSERLYTLTLELKTGRTYQVVRGFDEEEIEGLAAEISSMSGVSVRHEMGGSHWY